MIVNSPFKIFAVLGVALWINAAEAQILAGKIVYERKTNLYKKFKDEPIKDWIKEGDKIKTDEFELYFNDSLSCFKSKDSELREDFSWATSKNESYRNLKTGKIIQVKDIWGEGVYVSDSMLNRKWKITDSKRNIAGYNCRKAIWQADDSTKIYAWFCSDIIPAVGPETFGCLPGAILGLANEDGGIIYFAKSVEKQLPAAELLIPAIKRQKIYSNATLRSKLEKDFGREKWGKAMIKNVFGYF